MSGKSFRSAAAFPPRDRKAAAGLNGAVASYSATAPASPVVGELWVKPPVAPDPIQLSVWTGTEWLLLNG